MSHPLQGEIYWADLEPTVGREQRGRRPVLILSKDSLNRLPLTLLVMIGTGAERIPRRFPTDLWVTALESGLPKDSVFMGLQMRSVDRSRLGPRVGRLSAARILEAAEIVRQVMHDP